MKNKIFNLHLFIDAMKQLKIIGLTSLIIMCLEAVIIPIGLYFSSKNVDDTNTLPQSATFFDVHFLLIFSFIIIAPLLTLYLFNFVNKRNASDFYHSLPHSRVSLFLSYFGAIVSWLLIIILGSTLLSIIASLFLKNYYIINVSSIFVTMFNIIAGSLFVAACVAFAICITGTLFNNVIISGILIFLPRMIITVILYTVASALPLISTKNFIPLLDAKYNVVSGFIFSALGFCNSNSLTESLTNTTSGIYTLAVAIIITILALLLFVKRKSESAGYSAPNRYLQAAFRIVIALIVCLIPIYMIFEDFVNDVHITGSTIFEYFIVYLIAIAVYFIYELITTRKFANIIRSIPTLLILIIINIGILVSMLGLFNKVINFTPDADDIDSIQIFSNHTNYAEDPMQYFTQASGKIELNNDKINQIVSNSLKSSYDMINESLNNYIYAYNNSVIKTVAIKSDGHTYYRNIMLSTNEASTITSELATIQEYKDIYQSLPEIGENNTTVSFSNTSLSKDAVFAIYKVFTNEVANMEFKDWYSLLYKDYYGNSIDTITITSTIGIESYTASIPISTDLPETCNSYLKQVSNDTTKYIGELSDLLNNPTDDIHFSIDITPYNFSGINYNENIFSLYWYNSKEQSLTTLSENELASFISIVNKYSSIAPTVESAFLKVSVWISNYNENVSDNYNIFIPITDNADIIALETILDSISK